jgi:uncharacterized tellurite resistance protein B-like protein
MSISENFDSGDKQMKKSHCRNLIRVALADGHLDDIEYQFLVKIGNRFGVSEEEITEIMNNIDKYHFKPPSNKEDRFLQMLNLVRMMMIDGVIDDKEMILCEKFAVGLGFPMEKTTLIINYLVEAVKKSTDEDDIIEGMNKL